MTGATAFQKAAGSGEINQCSRQNFLSLYPNRLQAILKPRGSQSWVTLSRHAGSVSDAKLLNAVGLVDDAAWGCRWASRSRFAVLDVDVTSKHYNEIGLARLRHALALVGINAPKLYQSSDSKGWHLYLFFSEWVASDELNEALKQLLVAQGFVVKQGQLEIFPSNNGLRLPLQRGFAWLDDQGNGLTRREELSADEAIARFMKDLDSCSHDWHLVQTRIGERIQAVKTATTKLDRTGVTAGKDREDDGFSTFFTHAGMIQEVYQRGRSYWIEGLTDSSQRHNAILCVGHYLWYGDEELGVKALPGIARSEERAQRIEEWLKQKHNGYSEAVLRGNWKEIGTDVKRACNWAGSEGTERPQNRYPLTDRAIDRLVILTTQTGRTWSTDDFQKGNARREEGAREKIRAAALALVEAGRRITLRGLERRSGCRRETIRRHSDIWAPLRLSNGLGDLSGGAGAFGPSSSASFQDLLVSDSSDESCSSSSSQLESSDSVFEAAELSKPSDRTPIVQWTRGLRKEDQLRAVRVLIVFEASPWRERAPPQMCGALF